MSAATRRRMERERARLNRKRSAAIQAAAELSPDFPRGLVTFDASAETRAEWIEAAAEGDGKKLKRFGGVAYTGGGMKVGFGRPVVIDLQGLTAGSDVIPFLKDHDPADVVGHGSAEIGKRQVKVSGVVSGEGETDGARRVLALASNGFPWQMSVGVEPVKVEAVDAGDSVIVNGRTVAGPAYVLRAGLLREVSFVAIGADGKTSSAIAANIQGGSAMDFESWLKAKGFDAATLNAGQLATLRAAYDAEVAAKAEAEGDEERPATPTVDVDAIVAKAVAAAVGQVTNAQEVEGVFAQFGKGIDGDKLATIRAKASAEKWDRNRTELECRREARPTAPAIHADGGGDLNAQALEVGLLRASGIASAAVDKLYDDKVLAAADAPRYRRMTLHKALGLLCHAAGVYAPLGDKEGLVEAAFKAHQKLATFDAFSSLSLSGILGNTANKAMLAAYDAVDTSWQKIAAVRSHSDFKVHTLYRLDADGAFKKVGANGELKLSSLTETGFTNQLGTYGTILSLTRRDMVNDSLGAFLQIAGTLGRLASLRIDEAVFVLLLSNPSSFFSAGNGNYQTGAGALAIGTLTTLAGKFDDMVDGNDKPVLIRPSVLLTGTALKVTAQNLFKEVTVVASTTANAPITANNPHAGLYQPVSSPFVNNTRIKDQDGVAISGQSATAFALFSDPAVRAAMGVAFLNGEQTPTIQTSEMDFAQLGMQFRGFIDFGVGMEDPSAAAWSTGT